MKFAIGVLKKKRLLSSSSFRKLGENIYKKFFTVKETPILSKFEAYVYLG